MGALIIVVILVCIDIYAFQAFRVVATDWSTIARWIVYGIYWSAPIITVGALIGALTSNVAAWNRTFTTYLFAFIVIIYLSKMVMLIPLLIDDIRRVSSWLFNNSSTVSAGSGGINRSTFLAQLAIILGSIPLLTLGYGMIRNAYRYKLFRQTVKIDDLPEALEGLQIVQISDAHVGSFTFKEPVQQAIDIINEQKADLIFFTGDLVNSAVDEMNGFMDIFSQLNAKYGVYSVLGNHDYGRGWSSDADFQQHMQDIQQVHKDLGWDLLMNEHRLLTINNEQLAVIGVENQSASSYFPKRGKLAEAHQGTETAALKLLLTHDPTHWDDEVNQKFQDIAITFSGHTHGMQFGIEIPGFRWSPAQYIFKQWAGLYQKGKQFLYVNRGLGFLGYPGRVGILPEITLLELKKR